MVKRSDEIYKEIENFGDYELTQCIAYEMAIRNDDVKKLLSILKEKEMDSSSSIKHLEELIEYGVNSRSPKKANYKYSVEYEIAGRLIGTQSDKNAIWKRDDSNEKIINTFFPIDKKVKVGLSRPQLEFKNSKVAAVDINFSLPKKELLAYVEKIKDDFDKDFSIIKTPIELLGRDLQEYQSKPIKNYPKKPKAEQIADMFFIYDYVTDRIKQVKEYNERYKAELNEKLSFIRNNKTLSTKDKKIQGLEAKRDYEEAKSEATIKTICEEDEIYDQIGLKGDSVYQYYRAMRPYIEEGRYKELITGVAIL